MTTQMNATYINALLADASYVQLTDANKISANLAAVSPNPSPTLSLQILKY